MGKQGNLEWRHSGISRARALSAAASAALLIGVTAPTFAQDASFKGLGVLDPGARPPGSLANGISSDGTKIVGRSFFYNPDTRTTEARAFVWSQDTGMFALPVPIPGLDSDGATAISADGYVVCGHNGFAYDGYYEIRNGTYWTDAMGADPNATYFDEVYYMTDVTADGSLMVGATRPPDLPWPIIDSACYFTEDEGVVPLGYLPNGVYTSAEAVSDDGSVIVGFGDGIDAMAAFRWTADTGVQFLDGQEDGIISVAHGITPDGSTIVGGYGLPHEELFRWTEANHFEFLGRLEGYMKAFGLDVSADASVIVGYAQLDWDGTHEAIIWTEEWGVRALADVLEADYGLDLTGWTLERATGISDDGSTICGAGVAPDGYAQAWVATLPIGGGSGFELTVESPCPSGGNARVSWTGASGNAQVAILFARNQGRFVIPGGPCAGTQLGLGADRLQLVAIVPSDRNGAGSQAGRIPAGVCGAYLQLVDVSTCETSNVARIE